MLTPRWPDTPVLVLDTHLVRKRDLTISNDRNGQRRDGLMDEVGGRRGQPGEMLKGVNATTGSAGRAGQEQPHPTASVLPVSQARPTRTTYIVSVQSTQSAATRSEGGARVEIEALPGQNQDKPSLDDVKIQPQVLPGVNQDTSNMGEVPKPVTAATPTSAPAITVDRPLPGQNQANPIMGEVLPLPAPTAPAPPTLPTLPSQPPPLPPPVSSTSSALSPSSEVSASLLQATMVSTSLASSTVSMPVSIITSSMFTPSAITSFVTITRSEQGKEGSKATLALSSTLPSSISETSTDQTESATPQAVAVAQSIPGVISATTAIATITLTPTATASDQGGSILHPTARTLLILFVILGQSQSGCRRLLLH